MSQRILIIDDDNDLFTVLEKRLRPKNLELFRAGTAREGLEFVRRENPELVMLDINLPDQSGMEIISSIKSINDHVPIMMVSGDTNPKLIVSAMKEGASDYVEKPFEYDDLVEKVS